MTTLPESTLIEDGALCVNTDDGSIEVRPATDGPGVRLAITEWADALSAPDIGVAALEVTDEEWDAMVAHVARRREHAANVVRLLRAAKTADAEVVIDLFPGVLGEDPEGPRAHVLEVTGTTVLLAPNAPEGCSRRLRLAVTAIESVLPADTTLDPVTMRPRRRAPMTYFARERVARLLALARRGWDG